MVRSGSPSPVVGTSVYGDNNVRKRFVVSPVRRATVHIEGVPRGKRASGGYVVLPFDHDTPDRVVGDRVNSFLFPNEYPELEFMDIGLPLDTIGGSRANGFFYSNFGLVNYNPTGKGTSFFNKVCSFEHRKIVCGFGGNPTNFCGAVGDLCLGGGGKDYMVHGVAFSSETMVFMEQNLDPAKAPNRHIFKNDSTLLHSNHMQLLCYERGLRSYLERLQLFRRRVRQRFGMFGDLVSAGRKTRFVFMVLSKQDCDELRGDEGLAKLLWDNYAGGFVENVVLIPCVENIGWLPRVFVCKADMVLAYGGENTGVLRDCADSMGFKFRVGKSYEDYKTVGVVFSRFNDDTRGAAKSSGMSSRPTDYHFKPLFGLTKEFFRSREERENWECAEDKKYREFLSSLDDGSGKDKAIFLFTERKKCEGEMFAGRYTLETEEGFNVNRLRPRIVFT